MVNKIFNGNDNILLLITLNGSKKFQIFHICSERLRILLLGLLNTSFRIKNLRFLISVIFFKQIVQPSLFIQNLMRIFIEPNFFPLFNLKLGGPETFKNQSELSISKYYLPITNKYTQVFREHITFYFFRVYHTSLKFNRFTFRYVKYLK